MKFILVEIMYVLFLSEKKKKKEKKEKKKLADGTRNYGANGYP